MDVGPSRQGRYDTSVKAAYERYLAARVEVYGEEKAAKRPQTLSVSTIGGASWARTRVSGFSMEASRLSTGLMR